MIFDLIVLALKNIRRKKLRSILTMLGIVIGVASVAVVMAIGTGGKNAVANELNRFGLNGLSIKGVSSDDGRRGSLTDNEYNKVIDAFSEAKEVMPIKIYQNCAVISYEGRKGCMVWGIGDNAEETISLNVKYGNYFTADDMTSEIMECIIDTNIADFLYKRENVFGKDIDIIINGKIYTFKIKGIVNSGDSMISNLAGDIVPSFIYIPYTTLKRLCNYSSYDQLIINLKDNRNIDEVGEEITDALSRYNGLSGGYVAENMVKQKEKLETIIDIITAIVSAVAAISLVVGGLGIMTIMLVAVNERKKEIGLKKAIGATNSMIVFEFIIEAVIITFCGGVMGMLLSGIIAKISEVVLNFKVEIDIRIMLLSLIFSVFIGIIFSVYPAKKAADLSPIEALRFE